MRYGERVKFDELRKKHPKFIYESFKTRKTGGQLVIAFRFRLEPDIVFEPQITIPADGRIDERVVNLFGFHLGLVECISYWKAACPAELVIEAGSLTKEQIAWWHDLFIHGLGEFFFKNDIDFTKKNLLTIRSGKNTSTFQPASVPSPDPPNGDIVLVGGGKDSAVSLELLKKSGRPTRPLVLNPTRAALDNIKIAGLPDPLIVLRTIDPTLLELNKAGYLNGHTPFSAYLAFLGTFVAVLSGYQHVVVSNEASSNEGNVLFHGFEVNHQYSKSFRFEKRFRKYCQKYLTPSHHYFSFLRPINEFQISMLFSQYPQYFPSFRSCNVGAKQDRWCGACAKCAFVYLSLFPFVSYERMGAIFGTDLFTKPETIAFIRELVGLGVQMPFECVGTKEEARLALALSIKKYQRLGKEAPQKLMEVEKELGGLAVDQLKKISMNAWNRQHFLPDLYEGLLKDALNRSV